MPEFTRAGLPYGIFSRGPEGERRVGVAYRGGVLDLFALSETGLFDFDRELLRRPFLNDFIALGKKVTDGARSRVQAWLEQYEGSQKIPHLIPRSAVALYLPVRIGDYTDFYSSIEHATNVGRLFRDPAKALLPNWRHLPIGYHGRASSIVVSGTPIPRPRGQRLPAGAERPVFGPTEELDFELEMAFVIGRDSQLGQPIPIAEAEDYIFGLALFNDWSARDIQRWEYRPLGPFLGKSFASTMAPWVVPFAALEPHRTRGPAQEPAPLPYLTQAGKHNLDIELEVSVNERTVCRTNFRHMYWSMAQQLAHHTSNGCNVRVGDVMASGTISGGEAGSYGSLLELTRGGKEGNYLHDGDTVSMRAHAGAGAARVDFGELTNTITP